MAKSSEGTMEMHAEVLAGLSLGGNQFGPLTGAVHGLSLGRSEGAGPTDGG